MRSGRLVNRSQICGLAAIVSSSGASQSSGSDAVKASPMSATKMRRGIPSSHGLSGRAVPVRSFQRADSAMRPGKSVGSKKSRGQPFTRFVPFRVMRSMNRRA